MPPGLPPRSRKNAVKKVAFFAAPCGLRSAACRNRFRTLNVSPSGSALSGLTSRKHANLPRRRARNSTHSRLRRTKTRRRSCTDRSVAKKFRSRVTWIRGSDDALGHASHLQLSRRFWSTREKAFGRADAMAGFEILNVFVASCHGFPVRCRRGRTGRICRYVAKNIDVLLSKSTKSGWIR